MQRRDPLDVGHQGPDGIARMRQDEALADAGRAIDLLELADRDVDGRAHLGSQALQPVAALRRGAVDLAWRSGPCHGRSRRVESAAVATGPGAGPSHCEVDWVPAFAGMTPAADVAVSAITRSMASTIPM